MSTAQKTTTVKKVDNGELVTPAEYRNRCSNLAIGFLSDWVGEERAREAAGRLATALSASAAAAKNPKDFYECTPQSIAKVIAVSALTGIMVGTGATALAYAIPRRPRQGEKPQLQYQLSHRGIAALAMRAGFSLVGIAISTRDVISVDNETGDVVIESRDFDNPPTSEEDLRGILVVVKSIKTGVVVARGWCAKSLINERRAASDSYCFAEKPGNAWAKESDPWHKWYVEMAMKTAMHYAIGRGWCVVDDTEAVRALQVDRDEDLKRIEVGLEDGTATDALTAALCGPQDDVPTFDASATSSQEAEPVKA